MHIELKKIDNKKEMARKSFKIESVLRRNNHAQHFLSAVTNTHSDHSTKKVKMERFINT